MTETDKLIAKIDALNHIVMHLMALEVSREDDPLEAAELLQMRTILAIRVKLDAISDPVRGQKLELMLVELNKVHSAIVRYFEP